jgi:hypothetical protein
MSTKPYKWQYSSDHVAIKYSVQVNSFRLKVYRRHGVSENWRATLHIGAGTYWAARDLGTLSLVKAKRAAVKLLRETLSNVLSELVSVPVEEGIDE